MTDDLIIYRFKEKSSWRNHWTYVGEYGKSVVKSPFPEDVMERLGAYAAMDLGKKVQFNVRIKRGFWSLRGRRLHKEASEA